MSPKARRHRRRLIRSAEGNLGALPTDLILEIFSRLPSKFIARCRCLSKLWASLLGSPNFTELFLTHSATQPRLLFTVRRKNLDWCLYSCPQPHISDKNPESRFSVTAEFHMSLLNHWIYEMSPSISGLIYSPSTRDLCNPRTRQLLRLPYPPSSLEQSFFGYDPIDKQFSVLAICSPLPPRNKKGPSSYFILKLGSGRLSWRSLKCPLDYYPLNTSICINGILYYCSCKHKIACFDLNSEEFKFIDQPWYDGEPPLLVNFKSKLGGIIKKWKDLGENRYDENGYELELSLWVLEDVEKQEWSQQMYNVYNLPVKWWNKYYQPNGPYRILGVTGKGEIVLTLHYTTRPFYVYFFNPERITLQKVRIRGFKGLFKCSDGRGYSLHGCVDYVEELRSLS